MDTRFAIDTVLLRRVRWLHGLPVEDSYIVAGRYRLVVYLALITGIPSLILGSLYCILGLVWCAGTWCRGRNGESAGML